MVIHLSRGDDDDRIPTDEHDTELPGNLPVHSFLRVLEDRIDVDVKGLQCADDLLVILKFDDDPLISGIVQCIEWSGFH